MKTINLRDYYPDYTEDYYVEVEDNVASALAYMDRCERTRRNKLWRYRAFYSLDAFQAENDMLEHSPSAEEVYERKELAQALEEALLRLPAKRRQRVLLHCVDGLSMHKIAQSEGVSTAAVDYTIHRSLDEMRKSLTSFVE